MPEKHASWPAPRTIALVGVTMAAFAANSLLCRFALRHESIDPASFCTIRLVSGALSLSLFMRLRAGSARRAPADWGAALLLFTFVGFFSFAYVTLPVGTGALILMSMVQLTMFSAGFRAGERLAPAAWLGVALAVAGFLWLVAPTVAAPTPLGAALMAVAGLAWGLYSLRGRRALDPLACTAASFAWAAVPAVALNLILLPYVHANALGIAMAIASGAVTSGMGFVIWYTVLPRLSAFQAATVQLSVSLITTAGGAFFLSEPITSRLAGGTVAILGGVALVLANRTLRRGC